MATAARAPSVHNTQPWRFRASRHTIDLLADRSRKLPRIDPTGREMLVSCGAALFGLRLAIRDLGYLPDVQLLPDPAQTDLLARVRFGAAAPIGPAERQMLTAMPYRHTHRGPFTADPVPRSLLAGLQHDVMVESCTLVLVERPSRYQQLSALVTAADHQQHTNPAVRAELRRWTRPQGSPARDGVPAYAHPAASAPVAGKLAQRDFDLGRHLGLLEGGGSPPAVTGILITPADSKADWLRAGQALHRLLLHAATQWVFPACIPSRWNPRLLAPRSWPASRYRAPRKWCSSSAAATAPRQPPAVPPMTSSPDHHQVRDLCVEGLTTAPPSSTDVSTGYAGTVRPAKTSYP